MWGISQFHTLAVRRTSQVLNLINCRIVSRSMFLASWWSVTQNWLYFCAAILHPCNCRFPLLLSASAITSPASPIALVWSAIGFEFIRTCQSDCGKCQLCCVDTPGARGQPVSGHGTHWAAVCPVRALHASLKKKTEWSRKLLRKLVATQLFKRPPPLHLQNRKFYCQECPGLWRRVLLYNVSERCQLDTLWKLQIIFIKVRQWAVFLAKCIQ